ncbi:protein of unknown function [Agrobacterium pusense]|uniref:Uncharacterized protein n=1 Tax=Agrobacterium pusense TaxID=648995 RepID=U4PQ31_9HYPH|nr:protein of unknown function [Agrobacterium pusense]
MIKGLQYFTGVFSYVVQNDVRGGRNHGYPYGADIAGLSASEKRRRGGQRILHRSAASAGAHQC